MAHSAMIYLIFDLIFIRLRIQPIPVCENDFQENQELRYVCRHRTDLLGMLIEPATYHFCPLITYFPHFELTWTENGLK